MSILLIIVLILAVCGIVWAYPRLPSPANIILVVVVAIACLLVILSLAGIVPGGVTLT